jgi:type III secretory pathway component EscU
MNEPFCCRSALINETECLVSAYSAHWLQERTLNMLFLLCAAMIVGMTTATGIMLHAESMKPKAEKVRVYWN